MRYLLDDQYEEAIDLLRQSLTVAPNHQTALLNLGIALNEVGEYGEAESVFQKLINEEPEDPDLYVFRAGALMNLERYDEATGLLNTALKLDPNDATTWSVLATVLSLSGDEKGAAEAERRAAGLEDTFLIE